MSPAHDSDQGRRIDFARVNESAARSGEAVVRALFPHGRLEGREWVFISPHRPDRSLGSCKINVDTGKGGDFSTGVYFGDFVGAAAWASGKGQRDAAIALADSLGADPFEGGRA